MEETKNPIQVAGRLFAVLELLADCREASLTEISEKLHLNKSTAHRILSSLIYMEYVKQADDGKYQLSLKIVDLSNRIVNVNRENMLSIVYPVLHSLAENVGETVHFVQKDGIDAVYMAKMAPNGTTTTIASRIGSHVPLYRSAVGKAMAATMSYDEVWDLWQKSNIVKTTDHTITDFGDFSACLDHVRENGYATDDEENEIGVKCIAAAIHTPFDANGIAQYAFSVTGTKIRVQKKEGEIINAVLQTQKQMDDLFK